MKQDVELLDRVLGAAQHLLTLINDILDLSKIEAGRMELQLEDFALAPLIESVVKTVEPLAAKNENRLVVRGDRAIGSLHADSMRLRQALLNLMSSAVYRAWHDLRWCTVCAGKRPGLGYHCCFRYRIGMTPEQMGKLLRRANTAALVSASRSASVFVR